MRKYALTALLFTALIACSGSDAGVDDSRGMNPTEALNQYYELLEAGDIRQAETLTLMPGEERRMDRLRQELRRTSKSMRSGVVQLDALEFKVQNDWAVVVTRTEVDQGESPRRLVREEFLFLQDGFWKIAPEAVRSDSLVAPLINEDMKDLFRWYRSVQSNFEEKYLKG